MTDLREGLGFKEGPPDFEWAIGRKINEDWLDHLGDIFEEAASPTIEIEINEKPGIVYIRAPEVPERVEANVGRSACSSLESVISMLVDEKRIAPEAAMPITTRRKKSLLQYSPISVPEKALIKVCLNDITDRRYSEGCVFKGEAGIIRHALGVDNDIENPGIKVSSRQKEVTVATIYGLDSDSTLLDRLNMHVPLEVEVDTIGPVSVRINT